MFMGEYHHSIDPKNRVIIPAKFRSGLGDSFVMSAGFDGCLYLCTYKDWEAIAAQFSTLPFGRETRDLQRYFMQNATEAEIDKQGRVLIPQHLKNLAKIDKDVVFVGANNKIELWAEESLENNKPDETVESIMEKFSNQYGFRF